MACDVSPVAMFLIYWANDNDDNPTPVVFSDFGDSYRIYRACEIVRCVSISGTYPVSPWVGWLDSHTSPHPTQRYPIPIPIRSTYSLQCYIRLWHTCCSSWSGHVRGKWMIWSHWSASIHFSLNNNNECCLLSCVCQDKMSFGKIFSCSILGWFLTSNDNLYCCQRIETHRE